jgi:hypothetical protein
MAAFREAADLPLADSDVESEEEEFIHQPEEEELTEEQKRVVNFVSAIKKGYDNGYRCISTPYSSPYSVASLGVVYKGHPISEDCYCRIALPESNRVTQSMNYNLKIDAFLDHGRPIPLPNIMLEH